MYLPMYAHDSVKGSPKSGVHSRLRAASGGFGIGMPRDFPYVHMYLPGTVPLQDPVAEWSGDITSCSASPMSMKIQCL